LTFSILKG